MTDLGIASARVVDSVPPTAAKRTKRAARTRPTTTRRAPHRKPPAAPAPGSLAHRLDRITIECDRGGILATNEERRRDIIAAIGLINRIVGDGQHSPEEHAELDRAESGDPDGYNHLLRARGELVRALASPAARALEVRAGERELARSGPARRPGRLVALDALDAHDLPGQFYMPSRSDRVLGIVGLQPHELDAIDAGREVAL